MRNIACIRWNMEPPLFLPFYLGLGDQIMPEKSLYIEIKKVIERAEKLQSAKSTLERNPTLVAKKKEWFNKEFDISRKRTPLNKPDPIETELQDAPMVRFYPNLILLVVL